MRPVVRGFWGPKQGSSDAEYEDALAWSRDGQGPSRFAVADGASESSFARLWAGLLVEAYACGALPQTTLARDLAPLQQRWRADVGARPLPWYVAEKTKAGAFAALAGLTLGADGGWCAVAIGDCCVFQVRDDALVTAFPLEDAAAFDNRPLLISSNPERNGRLPEFAPVTCGAWERGDTFLLMSDALAAYFLRGVLDERRTPSGVLAFGKRGFRRWLEGLRAAGAIRNDDVSLLKVQVR